MWTQWTVWTILLALSAAPSPGTTLIVANIDPNCVQPVYSPDLAALGVDPNAVIGYLLPATPGDPNGWYAIEGKFNRPPARACDPQGDVFKITCDNPAVSVTLDVAAGTWTFAADIVVGPNLFHFTVDDGRALSRFTVLVIGTPRPNSPPVLY